MSWISESNRWKHIIGGFVLAVVFTILCSLGAAIGMEVKDCQYYNGDSRSILDWELSCFDWLDVLATILGGILGQAVQILIVYLIAK